MLRLIPFALLSFGRTKFHLLRVPVWHGRMFMSQIRGWCGNSFVGGFSTCLQTQASMELLFQLRSLWVAWLKDNVFGRKGYWLTQDSTRSPTVRSMLQLKPTLNDFLRCLVKDGTTASFWFDTWTLMRPLISVLGDTGPRMLRVRMIARFQRPQ